MGIIQGGIRIEVVTPFSEVLRILDVAVGHVQEVERLSFPLIRRIVDGCLCFLEGLFAERKILVQLFVSDGIDSLRLTFFCCHTVKIKGIFIKIPLFACSMDLKRLFAAVVLGAKQAPLVIGGQAVMEGVMMKSKHHLATAVRNPKGKISLRHRKERSFAEKTGIHKIPFLRGAVILFETMIIGLRELNWSANESIGEEEEKLSTWEIVITLGLSIVIALALFKLLPLFLAARITEFVDGGNWMLNLLDGLFKFSIFVGYIVTIGFMKDVRRLFQYHGAEHKAVNCYEAGKKLTPKNAQRFTKKQARCGTTFVVYVFVLSIFLYLLIPFGSGFWSKYLLRIVLLPVIAGIAYEWIRFAGKCYANSRIVRWISAPGMAVQSLTTKEPDLSQLEVAIAALEKVLKKEGRLKA
jgi:uncharacterized protein YqhQ